MLYLSKPRCKKGKEGAAKGFKTRKEKNVGRENGGRAFMS